MIHSSSFARRVFRLVRIVRFLLATHVAIVLLLEIVLLLLILLLLLLFVLFFDQLGQDRSRCRTHSPSSPDSDFIVRQIIFCRQCLVACRTLLRNNFATRNVVRRRKEIIFRVFLSQGTDGRGRILAIFVFHTRRARCALFCRRRVIRCHGNAWVLFLRLLRNDGNNTGIGRSLLPVRIYEFLSDHQLLFPVFQPVFFGKSVVEKVRDVSRSPQPRLVVDLIEPYVEGRPFAEQAGIAAGVFLALQLSGQNLRFLELALLLRQEPRGSLGRIELGQLLLLLSLPTFLVVRVVPAVSGAVFSVVRALVVFGILLRLRLSRPLSIGLDELLGTVDPPSHESHFGTAENHFDGSTGYVGAVVGVLGIVYGAVRRWILLRNHLELIGHQILVAFRTIRYVNILVDDLGRMRRRRVSR
mmetsp:Transcript_18683/g.43237  ORF Transcript_18683/g.43237 Transcript_18683/m.43237 type:complete len:413 (+) Transcript_18683:886-2124(+)